MTFANSLILGLISDDAGGIDIFYATLGDTVWSHPILVSNHRFHSYRRNVCHLLVYEEVGFLEEQVCGLEQDNTASRRRASWLRKGIPTVYTQYFSLQDTRR
jgi:hypothetical protein